MSYYPILRAPQCEGVTTIFNFAPNNWQEGSKELRYLNASFSDGEHWRNTCLGEVEYDASAQITVADLGAQLISLCSDNTLYLSIGSEPAPQVSDILPESSIPRTSIPAWRASLGLTAPTGVTTSYQGEVDPFPAPGSLLTFGYFLQPSSQISNFLLFVNLERSPKRRMGFMELRDAMQPSMLLKEFKVTNNRLNIIPLDDLGFADDSLPLLVCRQMSGIPLYFSHTYDFSALSLEHTHPPASTVVHGDRFEAQRIMKTFWFSAMGD